MWRHKRPCGVKRALCLVNWLCCWPQKQPHSVHCFGYFPHDGHTYGLRLEVRVLRCRIHPIQTELIDALPSMSSRHYLLVPPAHAAATSPPSLLLWWKPMVEVSRYRCEAMTLSQKTLKNGPQDSSLWNFISVFGSFGWNHQQPTCSCTKSRCIAVLIENYHCRRGPVNATVLSQKNGQDPKVDSAVLSFQYRTPRPQYVHIQQLKAFSSFRWRDSTVACDWLYREGSTCFAAAFYTRQLPMLHGWMVPCKDSTCTAICSLLLGNYLILWQYLHEDSHVKHKTLQQTVLSLSGWTCLFHLLLFRFQIQDCASFSSPRCWIPVLYHW